MVAPAPSDALSASGRGCAADAGDCCARADSDCATMATATVEETTASTTDSNVRIGSFLFLFPFRRACSREDAREAVVPFMARILVHQLVALPHGQRHSPRPRPDCRVVNRVLV